MSLFDGLRHRLYVLWRGERYAAEIERELRFHVSLDALSAHADPRALDAELAAHRSLGNVTYYREEVRRMTLLGWFDHLRQDLSYAWRGLRRSPGFTIAVMVTLGLGMGVNAALFSFLDELFARPPQGVVRPGEVKRLYVDVADGTKPGSRFAMASFPYPNFRAISRRRTRAGGVGVVHVSRLRSRDRRRCANSDSPQPRECGLLHAPRRRAATRTLSSPATKTQIEAPTPVAVLSDAYLASGVRRKR